MRVHGDGTGDISLGVREGGGIGYAKLWPHVQGLRRPQPVPMLRGLADAAVCGPLLSRHLHRFHSADADTIPAVMTAAACAA